MIIGFSVSAFHTNYHYAKLAILAQQSKDWVPATIRFFKEQKWQSKLSMYNFIMYTCMYVMFDHPLNCTFQVRCWVLCVPSWVLRSTAAHSPRSLVAFRPTWRDSHCLIQVTLSRRTGRNWWRSCPALLAEYASVTLFEFLSCSLFSVMLTTHVICDTSLWCMIIQYLFWFFDCDYDQQRPEHTRSRI